jgi:hypothetical protein
MKPGDIVQIRTPNGWVPPQGTEDGQLCLLLEIRPIEYPAVGHKRPDYIVLTGGRQLTLKRRYLDRVYG